jgi:Protein of unknown function (DUF1569)
MAASAFFERLSLLKPTDQSIRSMISPAKMMHHCALINEAFVKERPSMNVPKFRQKFLKLLVLDVAQQTPKISKLNERYYAEIDNDSFEQQRERLIASLKVLLAQQEDLGGKHPRIGKNDSRNWGRFLWIHLNYHLREFENY